MKTIFTFIFLAIAFYFLDAQSSDKKLALVIGNSNYKNAAKLKNPVNDANLMAKTLKELGFEVILKNDADLKSMQVATADFTNKIDKYNVALFYYAGHGIQLDGENYLIPVDAIIDDKVMCKFEAFNINFINQAFQTNQNNMNIMILDACRNNPFRSWARGGPRGFSALSNQAAGTIIAFATREGETASDGTGNNGLFTEKLVVQMAKDLNITEVFQNTRTEVLKESQGNQCPQEWNMMTSNFSFKSRSGNANPTLKDTTNTEGPVFEKGKIEKSYGSISVDTEIDGDLYLDGKKFAPILANSTGNKLGNIAIGDHLIEIKGSEAFSQKISVKQNETVLIKVQKIKKTAVEVQNVESESISQLTDQRDNHIYNIVKIGNQVWMAENLKYECDSSWNYDNKEEVGNKFGRLYAFSAAVKSCPSGWHLPSDKEWQDLELEIGLEKSEVESTTFRGKIGSKIKSKGEWQKDKNGTDEFGFRVLPSGFRDFNGKGSFSQLNQQAFFWSSTSKGSNKAWRRNIHSSNEGVSRMNFDKSYAYSVRCLKDN